MARVQAAREHPAIAEREPHRLLRPCSENTADNMLEGRHQALRDSQGQSWKSGGRPSLYVLPDGEHRIAPRVIAALTSLVHDRQSAADYQHNRCKGNNQGSPHCDLRYCGAPKPTHSKRAGQG